MDLVEDWTGYGQSLLWEISDQFYKTEGVLAWSDQASTSIPHRATTNFQNAKSIAYLVKKLIKKIKPKERIKVLEIGAGSGRFSRNFLLACKRLKILDQVQLIISDYAAKNLVDIDKKSILKKFKKGQDYQLIELDICNLAAAKDLNDNNYKLENITCIIQNAVFEALPLTILRNHKGKIEELELRIQEVKEFQYLDLKSKHRQNRLLKDYRWSPYQAKTELEQKYFEKFKDFYKDSQSEYITYPYAVLDALDNLLKTLIPEGFIFSTNLARTEEEPWYFIADLLSHEIDSKFLLASIEAPSCSIDSQIMTRYLISPKQSTIDLLKADTEDHFVRRNNIKRYLGLYSLLKTASTKELADCYKFLLKEFTKLSYKSSQVYILWADYYQMIGDLIKAEKYYQKAKSLDFWADYSYV